MTPQCPVCEGETTALCAVDANRCCEDRHGVPPFAPAGELRSYVQCADCGFVHCPAMYAWSDAELGRAIYNADYVLADPEFAGARALQNAQDLCQLLAHGIGGRHLDLGGGAGQLTQALRAAGWQSDTADPFGLTTDPDYRQHQYQLVSAIEVLEHSKDPQGLMAEIAARLDPQQGLALVTTLVSDARSTPDEFANWWYLAPRNGHISLFTSNSLNWLARRHGLRYAPINSSFHALFRKVPPWAEHLLPDFVEVAAPTLGQRLARWLGRAR